MFKKCRNLDCNNQKSKDRAECPSCRGKRRRGNRVTRWKSGEGSPKILFIDIETYPLTALIWDSQLRHGNIGIDQIKDPGGMLCFAAKWYGDEEIIFRSKWEHGDLEMRYEAWQLMNEADIIVHYYGARFDILHLNSEFLKEGWEPYMPFKQVDLKMAVSRRFKLPSNKLDFLSRVLNLDGKEEHEGFKLWTRVLDGNEDARKRMTSYNKRDTLLLEECYEILLPWLPDHPHRHLYSGTGGCPRCGQENTMEDAGFAYTKVSKFKQYRCGGQNGCGSLFRSTRRISGVTIQDSQL